MVRAVGLSLVLAQMTVGCVGLVDTTDGEGSPGASPGASPGVTPGFPAGSSVTEPAAFGATAIRRLSAEEVHHTLLDGLTVDVSDQLHLLPLDEAEPFDNDYTTQVPSAALVAGLDALGKEAGERFVQDPLLRDAIAGCSPTGPSDRACFTALARGLGRILFRREVTNADVAVYEGFVAHSVEADDFNAGARMLVRAMVQDVEFIYRLEFGTPDGEVDGRPVLALAGFEIASRLSFLLWGSGPDEELLQVAESGGLEDVATLRGQAARMLADPRAQRQQNRFHRLWLGFKQSVLPPEYADAMSKETRALVRRVVFDERRPYTNMLTLTETFVTPELAAHYEVPAPSGAEDWVRYPDNRAGLLSHATFLSNSSKFDDTSPVYRGQTVNTRLLCRTIPDPPPDVDVDSPAVGVGPDACRAENYNMAERTDCAPCHRFMDPIGFGLEPWGPDGRFRAHEPDRPECPLDGAGNVEGTAPFSGPGELGQVLLDSGEFEPCFVDHFYRFAMGREAGPEDAATLESLVERFANGPDLVAFMIDFVSLDAFRHRVVEE